INDATFVNAGQITVSNGDSLIIDPAANTSLGVPYFDNSGSIGVGAGSYLRIGGRKGDTWSSEGTITANNATIDLRGAFTDARLDTLINNNSIILIAGHLTNSGTLQIGTGTTLGPLSLYGGTISGGTIIVKGSGLSAQTHLSAATLD